MKPIIFYPSIVLLCGIIFFCGRLSMSSKVQALQYQLDTTNPLDYQIETFPKSYAIFNGNNFIGEFSWDETRPLDSILIANNY